MSVTATPSQLAPSAEARLIEFARACRSAARAVAFYPAAHPSIGAALSQIVEVSRKATEGGPLLLTVLPDSLLVGGLPPSRVDVAVVELADLLHRHSVGSFKLHGPSDVESWRRLLVLLARPPEDVRADGGIRRLWSGAGGSSIEVREIDYAELLRGHIGGDSAELAAVIAHYLEDGVALSLEDAAVRALTGIIAEPPARDDPVERAAHADRQASAVVKVLKGLAEVTLQTQPERFDEVFRKASTAGGQAPPETMLALIARRGTAEVTVGDIDVVGAWLDQMDDPTIARFVAGAVLTDTGPTGRLAHAFSTLVPDESRRRGVLALAQAEAAKSPLSVEAGFLDRWTQVERTLESYADRQYVSDEYASELDRARQRPIDLEELTEDPPERIAAWTATVNDDVVRRLDLQLLLDLLAVEPDPYRWREVLETVLGHIDVLVRAGQFGAAADLVEAVAREADQKAVAAHRQPARDGLDRLVGEQVLKHALTQVRSHETEFRAVKRFFHAVGPASVGPLVDHWSAETDPRVRRRLQDIVVGLGARGRSAIQQLIGAADWEVRRAAVQMLRELGGGESLAALVPLLVDADPRVRAETLRTMAFVGDERAFHAVRQAITTDARASATLAQELGIIGDERAGPLLCHLVGSLDHRTAPRDLYLSIIGLLGGIGGADAVAALGRVLAVRVWWPPGRSRGFHQAAAAALAQIGGTQAVEALQAAARSRSGSARAAARRALGQAAPRP
jgi:hypothetical protein